MRTLKKGTNTMTMAKFYMAVVQAVLAHGADSWVITEKNWKKLRSFHSKALRHMTGKHIIEHSKNDWECPCHVDLQWKYGLFSVKKYAQRRRGILKKCLEEKKRKPDGGKKRDRNTSLEPK